MWFHKIQPLTLQLKLFENLIFSFVSLIIIIKACPKISKSETARLTTIHFEAGDLVTLESET
jgi:hypothetical protein